MEKAGIYSFIQFLKKCRESGGFVNDLPRNCFVHYRWLGETGEAYRSLAKAAEILRITHGTNTNFMKELFVKLEEARGEFSYKISSKEEEID